MKNLFKKHSAKFVGNPSNFTKVMVKHILVCFIMPYSVDTLRTSLQQFSFFPCSVLACWPTSSHLRLRCSFRRGHGYIMGSTVDRELRIISIAMEFDAMLFNLINQVSCIHGKESRTKHRPMRDRADDPDCSRGAARVRNPI